MLYLVIENGCGKYFITNLNKRKFAGHENQTSKLCNTKLNALPTALTGMASY